MSRALLLLGAPGAGKGTVASLLVSRAGFAHLSTGDEIRREMADPASELGKRCRPFMDRGHFVPDDIAFKIAGAFLARRPPGRPVLLDGFPRNVPQVALLDELLHLHSLPLGGVFWLNAAEDPLTRRLARRRLCPSCGLLTHASPGEVPARTEICPSCGCGLIRRPDDQPALIAERMKLYHQQTGPLIELFRQRGVLVELAAEDSPGALAALILARMDA